jgi:hypothetical protein
VFSFKHGLNFYLDELQTNATLPRLMFEFGVLIECSRSLPKFSPCSTSHLPTFSTSKRLTFSLSYLYQEDEQAQPGDLYSPPPPTHTVSLLSLPLYNVKNRPARHVYKSGSIKYFALQRSDTLRLCRIKL